MFDEKNREEIVADVIERHRYDLATTTLAIAKEVIKVEDEYLAAGAAAEEARTDGWHYGSSI